MLFFFVEGWVAGCQAMDPLTPVTFERMITINYGFDWISALAFSGRPRFFLHLHSHLQYKGRVYYDRR